MSETEPPHAERTAELSHVAARHSEAEFVVPPATPRNWLRTIEAVSIFTASCLVAVYVVSQRAVVTEYLGQLGFWAYPIAIALLAIVASAPFSVTDALAVMNGVIFGPVGGSIVNACGILAAAVVGYGIALRTSALLDLESKIARLPGWVRRFRVGSFAFLVVVRIIPGVGGTIATQVAAAMRVPLLIHVGAMAAIAIPICTVLAISGDSLAGFFEHRVSEPVRSYMHRHRHHQPVQPARPMDGPAQQHKVTEDR